MTRIPRLSARRRALAGLLVCASACLLAGTAQAPAADGNPAIVTIVPLGPASRSATVGTRYRQPLRVRVLDAGGNPVAGASVTFALGSAAGGGAGAAFPGGSAQATAVTDTSGRAGAPALTANGTAGSFTATAQAGTAGPVGFALRNVAGRPAAVTPGVAASATTAAGTRFPIRLAVTVTDAGKNPVAGAMVTFSAPARGPSGRFASGARTARVRTDAAGKAVAPAFTATARAGGYIVRAVVARAAPAAFALVNERAGSPA